MTNCTPLGVPASCVPQILVIAGSRPEAARLAPVAQSMEDLGRLDAVVVAGGADPMRVHDAFEVLGSPPGITVLLGGQPTSPVQVAAALAVRLDELMVDLNPAAVLVSGGGTAALVAAQVAFFRKVPLVQLYTGTDVDDLLCPFPEEGNRRVISQLASLFLHTVGRGVLCNVAGPNSIAVGDTLAAVSPAEPGLAQLAARARSGASRVGLLDASTPSIVAAAAQLFTYDPELELALADMPPAEPGGSSVLAWLRGHPRVHLLDQTRFVDLIGTIAVAAFAASDRPHRYYELLACGVPALLVDSNGQARDNLDQTWLASVAPEKDALLRAMSAVLNRPTRTLGSAGPAAARRVEHAVAWMLGLERDPVPATDPATAR